MSDSSLFVVLLLVGVSLGSIFGYGLGLKKASNCIKSTESVVESADIEKVQTNTGLVVENKGFNVGDTLVIIKK